MDNSNGRTDILNDKITNNTNNTKINDNENHETSNNLDPETKLWLEENLIPKLKVALNEENSVSEYKAVSSSPLVMSSVIFLDLKLMTSNHPSHYSLVIKRPVSNELMRDRFQSDRSFHNEILFYEKYGKNCKDYPRCFYTLEDPPINSVIVVENINQRDYHSCPQKVNLDMKYIVAAMQEIGRFHARSYIFRHKSSEEFFQIVANIQETRYEYMENNTFPLILNNVMTKIIKCLRERNYDKVFCDKADIFFGNSFDNIMRAALKPKNSQLATLCHGDFTVNNTFFKETKSGVSAMLFDFAIMCYGSPAIDLSTFIYLSVSPDDIRMRFGEMFDAYYDSLMDCLKQNDFLDLSGFLKESFLRDYKENALFGYMIARFYLPVMYGVPLPDIEILLSAEAEQMVHYFEDIGGDKFREMFTEMLLDLRKSGGLDHLL